MLLSRLQSPFVAAHATLLRRAFGTLLLLLSMAALSTVEGTPTLGELARRAQPLQANNPPRIDDVRFVAATGLLTSSMLIGDDAYLKPGPFVAVRRRTEMFAWAQGRDGDAPSYTTGWTETPENSADFDVPEGHENPTKRLTSRSFVAGDARVGVYDVDLGSLVLPPFQSLELSQDTLQGDNLNVVPDALFVGRGTADEPQVGDLRIRYEVLPQTVTVTAFAQLDGKRLKPFVAPHGLRLYHLYYGSRDSALHKLAPFAGPSPILFRILTLVAVWFSMMLLTRYLRFDPRLENLSVLVRSAVLLGAACLLTMVTVALSVAGAGLWASVLLSALVIFGMLLWDVRQKAASLPITTQAPSPAKPAPQPQPTPLPQSAPPAPLTLTPPPAKMSASKQPKQRAVVKKAAQKKAPSKRPARASAPTRQARAASIAPKKPQQKPRRKR